MAPCCPSLCFALTLEKDRQYDEYADDDAGNIIWHVKRHHRLTDKLNKNGTNRRAQDGCSSTGQWSSANGNGGNRVQFFAQAIGDRVGRGIKCDKR